MKIEYDRKVDALYIRFQSGKVQKSIEVREGIILDIAEDGKSLFGIEILDASRQMPVSELAHIDANLPLRKAS